MAAAVGVRDMGTRLGIVADEISRDFAAAVRIGVPLGLRKAIANVHVKNLRPGPEWLPADEGIIDYGRHFAALQQAGYNGPISLEPHMDGSAETIRRCRDAVLRLWKRGEPSCESRAEAP